MLFSTLLSATGPTEKCFKCKLCAYILLTFITSFMYLSMYNETLLRNLIKSKLNNLKMGELWSVFFIWASVYCE